MCSRALSRLPERAARRKLLPASAYKWNAEKEREGDKGYKRKWETRKVEE